MQMGYYFNEEGSGFMFGNSGLGPARLKWFQILVDGQPKINFADMLHALGFEARPEFHFGRPGPNYYVDSVKKQFWLKPGPAAEEMNSVRDRAQLNACYCSVFDECWLVSDKFRPRPVSSCEPTPAITFGGSVE